MSLERDYQKDFVAFLNNPVQSPVTVGNFLGKMTQYFCEYNTKLGVAEIAKRLVAKTNVGTVDQATGKAITGTKADTLTDASPESADKTTLEKDVENLEQILITLRNMQKGLEVEYNKTV